MSWAALTGLLLAGMTAATPPTAIPVRGGNALTLPAHRHIVRVSRSEGSVLLAAVQQGGKDGHGLRLFRSDNGGGSWKQEGVIHDGSTYDRADLVVVGRDVALVYAVETPDSQGISGSTSRDVYFQWWRYSASRNHWLPDKPVRVFDSTSSSTAYYRAELARDSRGRFWVQAFFREKDARNTLALSVSSDGGSTFRTQSALARGISKRGGGRLISLGSRLMMLWSSHDGHDTTHYRIRDDSASVSTWSSTRTAFSDGIYHGAAMSAVADGKGGLHLVYKDNSERLMYRRFNGSSFGSAVKVLEDGDWATQPALVRSGSSLYLFYNQPRSDGSGYRLWVRALSSSGKPGAGRELASVRLRGLPGGAGRAALGRAAGVLLRHRAVLRLQLPAVLLLHQRVVAQVPVRRGEAGPVRRRAGPRAVHRHRRLRVRAPTGPRRAGERRDGPLPAGDGRRVWRWQRDARGGHDVHLDGVGPPPAHPGPARLAGAGGAAQAAWSAGNERGRSPRDTSRGGTARGRVSR
ncbi:hypothetical protein [Corallococcus sp. 4LFB]|uniref:hypothetical protein n=1 Tax=Corallococcus sp. 4LFB TaxID=3383249 RepID=UPI003975BB23